MIRLARARRQDVERIEAVVHDVWKQEILPDVCRAQIERDGCSLWVAKEEEDVLGFASAFLTVDGRGFGRWEVDLVAVRPARQGEGVGQRLIAKACEDAERDDVVAARALIRVDNVASQKAFRRAGFATDGKVHHLLLWLPDPNATVTRCPGGVSLIPVDTLTYRGLWIEGLTRVSCAEQRAAVSTARAIIAQEDRLNTGALIPEAREHLLSPDLRNRGELQGRYQWFIRPQ